MELIKVGVIGLGPRGRGLISSMLICKDVEVVAVCDKYEERVKLGSERVVKMSGKTPKGYTNSTELINDPEVQAVVIASSWDTHTDLAIESMKAGKYTAVEVGGAYDLEDCWALVRTYEETKTPIMLLENCCFDEFELTATAMARAGKFGRIVYAHGAYAHELLGEVLGGEIDKHYRLKNYTLRNCENYPTHEIGPIAKVLNITRGNKILNVSSFATKAGVGLSACANSPASPDPNQAGKEFNQGDIVVTNISCSNGEVINITLDTTLPRYYSREFTLRGTKGLCEQGTGMYLFANEYDLHEFFDTVDFVKKNIDNKKKYEEYKPEIWRNITEEQMKAGHGGMDTLEFEAFFSAIRNGTPMPIDVYDMATWMAITPLTEQSISLGGAPVSMPDFTRGKWMYREPVDVVPLPIPEEKGEKSEPKLGESRKI